MYDKDIRHLINPEIDELQEVDIDAMYDMYKDDALTCTDYKQAEQLFKVGFGRFLPDKFKKQLSTAGYII